MLKTLLVVLSMAGGLGANTIEVVQLYQPLSLHATDGVGDIGEGEDLLQAAVMARPFAVSGAIPEDLVKAIAIPHRIPSNNPFYKVEDANLLNLCKIGMSTELRGEILRVRFDVSEMVVPEKVDLTSRQILKLAIRAVRRTVTGYYSDGNDSLELSIGIIGVDEENSSLVDLATRFSVGR